MHCLWVYSKGQKLGGLGEDYLKGQRDAQIANAKVQQSYIDAQAEVVRAQAAAAQAAAQPAPQVQAAQPAQQWANQQPGQPQAQIPANGNGVAHAPNDTTEMRRGKTDLQWFGGAYERVVELRKAVTEYIDATKERPFKRNDQGKIIGASPKESAGFVMQAAHYIIGNKIDLDTLPAFRLFMQEQYADLLDLLLPNAPQTYRDDVVKCLTTVLAPGLSEEEDEDDEEEEEDDDEETPEPPRPSAKPPVESPPRTAARPAPAAKPASPPSAGTRRPVA